jgi:dTDP-glucose pyrophosphorylase
MKDWRAALVSPDTPIKDVLQVIDAVRIGVVVDGDRRLLGTITDGDIRRGLLRQLSLDQPVSAIMHTTPHVASARLSRAEIRQLPEASLFRFLPVVDDDNQVVGLEGVVAMVSPQLSSNLVVLMAGGKGTRLRPLTETVPKPMLKVGARPLLETILLHIAEQGFNHFLISVNYHAEMITQHFESGRRWNVDIAYLHEDRQLGTAGALSLIRERPDKPFVVMNGDLLTKVDLLHLLDYHAETNALATMCVREYDLQVPYGVVNIEANRIRSIEEKPVHRFFVNAGIYVFSPEVLDLIKPDTDLDMPALFDRIIETGNRPAVFPIREYWLDIGKLDDFHRANVEFSEVFS